MKSIINIFALCILLFPNAQVASAFTAGEDYIDSTLPFKGSVWGNSGETLCDYEYKMRFLLQTDKILKETLTKTRRLLEIAGKNKDQDRAEVLVLEVHQLMELSDNLDKVMATEFRAARSLLAANDNKSLLKMMLCHYYAYVFSQNANWPKIIGDLESLDADVTKAARDEADVFKKK
jgi:hypothetical protein